MIWADKTQSRYSSFVVTPHSLLAAGHAAGAPAQAPFLAAIDVANGQTLWRESLPAPAVKAGTALDGQGRIYVALENGEVLQFSE